MVSASSTHRTTASTASEVEQVGRMVADGMSTADIAAELGLQPRAVLRRVARWCRAERARVAAEAAERQATKERAGEAESAAPAVTTLQRARFIAGMCMGRAAQAEQRGDVKLAMAWLRAGAPYTRLVATADADEPEPEIDLDSYLDEEHPQ